VDKFNRKYRLLVQTQSGSTLEIKPPFTLEFDITRNVLTSANVCQVRVFNLNKRNRNQIRFDISNYGELRGIELRAGYGDNLPIVFAGNVSQAWSAREGVNFVSQIECYDGGYALANGTFDQQFIANTFQKDILTSMIQTLPGVTVGVIGEVEGQISRGNAYSGNTADLINQLVPNQFFIDNQKANILGDSECLQGDITVISPDAGLLGTPIREETIVNFDMLFEPRLKIGQLITLRSVTDDSFNGDYKVISVKHRGVISESVAGDAITSCGLFKGVETLQVVSNG
jgi:hypothetical protein